MINGTNGEAHPPVKENQKHVKFFRGDLCRTWTLTYSQDTKHYGLPCKRFILTKDVLANGTENPDNKCFTINEELPSGAYDASTCLFGTPTVMSLPHFYMGDPSYLEAFEGLKPNKSHHEFFLDLEPITGVTVGLNARLQLNIHLRRIPDIVIFEDLKVQSLVFPVIWQEIVLTSPEDHIQNFLNVLVIPKYYVGISCYFLLALGGVMATGAGYSIAASWFRTKRELDESSVLDEKKAVIPDIVKADDYSDFQYNWSSCDVETVL